MPARVSKSARIKRPKAHNDAANVRIKNPVPDDEVQSVEGAEPDGCHQDGDPASPERLHRCLERLGDLDDMTIPEQRIPQGQRLFGIGLDDQH